MSESNIEFYGLEDYDFPKRSKPAVICLFKTNRFGIYQVEYTMMESKYHGEVVQNWKLNPLPQEPSLDMFSKKEQLHIEKVCRIVWRMVYDTPAEKHRFDNRNL